ncbi:MAG: capsular polysaccharide synthesis protein [Lachnospira sp.]
MIIRVLKNRIIDPTKVLCRDVSHGIAKIGFLRFLGSLFSGTRTGYAITNKTHTAIIKKLEEDYSGVIEKYRNYKSDCVYDSNAPIWVSWMQGYDQAPVIVKKCIDSIRNSTSHPVKVITKDNIKDFVYIPDYIMDKYEKGLITNAQFSDILRMSLLSQNGGLWIDATIFIPNAIPEDVFKKKFYTCKRKPVISNYVSQYRWTSFLNGCQKGCIVQKVMADLFLSYWKENDYLIDYLLVDYFMMVVYRNIDEAKTLIDDLEYNNSLIDELQSRMDLEFNDEEYNSLVDQEETYLFKLSWRMTFDTVVNGKPTYYGHFIS